MAEERLEIGMLEDWNSFDHYSIQKHVETHELLSLFFIYYKN